MDDSWGQNVELHGFFRPISPDTTAPFEFASKCHAPCCCLHISPSSIRPPMDWCNCLMEDVAQEAAGYNSPHTEPGSADVQPEEGGEVGSGAGSKETGIPATGKMLGSCLSKKVGKEEFGGEEELLARLLDWMTEKEYMEKRQLSVLKRGLWRLKGEMYGVVQVCALLLGVIYTAVANTTVLGCDEAWGPTTLAVVAAMTTAAGVVTRYLRLQRDQRRHWRLRRRSRKLEIEILKLRRHVLRQSHGHDAPASFDLDSLARSIPPSVYDRTVSVYDRTVSVNEEEDDPIPVQAAEETQDAYSATLVGLALLLTLFVSIFMAATCKPILCSPCKCGASSCPS